MDSSSSSVFQDALLWFWAVFRRAEQGVREELSLTLPSDRGECLFVQSAVLAACKRSVSWVLEVFKVLEEGTGRGLAITNLRCVFTPVGYPHDTQVTFS